MVWKRQKIPHRKHTMIPTQSVDPLDSIVTKYNPEYIIGIDEVGWGAIAGPLVCACAVYKVGYKNAKLRDSKTYTTERARERAFALVQESAEFVAYQEASPGNLEAYGASAMLQSSYLILAQRAISHYPNSVVIVDGSNIVKGLAHPQACLAKADSLITAVSAASIAAKVSRDTTMTQLGTEFPEYDWHNNKGYPTPKHLNAIKRVGVSIHHRRNIDLVLQLEKDHGEYKKELM